MQYGIEVVPFGEYADPRKVVELAVAAESAGWQGLWIWDHAHFPGGVGDPWVTLTAVAIATPGLRLVSGVTPLPRYRPHLLARTIHALDVLSEGRVVLGAGLGVDADLDLVGDGADVGIRARMTDEALDLVARFCSGSTVDHHGEFYTATGVQVAASAVQSPRIPVWIGGKSKPALRRAARWDGWIVSTIDENQTVDLTPAQLAASIAYVRAHRQGEAVAANGGFDVAVDGVSQPRGKGLVGEYEQAGATWWFEALFGLRGSHQEMLARVAAGPPD